MEVLVNEQSVSQILVSFKGPGDTRFELKLQGITPGQLVFIGEYLKYKGMKALDALETQQAAQSIVVPRGPLNLESLKVPQ